MMSSLRNRERILPQWSSVWHRFRNCRTGWIPWTTQEYFMILKLRAALEFPMSIPSLRGMIRRDSCLPPDTRNSFCTPQNAIESLLAREKSSLALFENSKNLASSSCGMRRSDRGKVMQQGQGVRRALQGSTIQLLDLPEKHSTWNPCNRTGGTSSQNCMMENPRNQISELHVDKFPESANFQCRKVNFKTEVCSNSGCPTIAMLWIKEVELPK